MLLSQLEQRRTQARTLLNCHTIRVAGTLARPERRWLREVQGELENLEVVALRERSQNAAEDQVPWIGGAEGIESCCNAIALDTATSNLGLQVLACPCNLRVHILHGNIGGICCKFRAVEQQDIYALETQTLQAAGQLLLDPFR